MLKAHKNMSIFLMIFVILQPILDAVTGLMIHLGTSVNITLGIIVRMSVMILAFLYILMSRKNFTNQQYRRLIIYLIVLALFLAFNLGVSYYYKPIFSLQLEVTAIAKMLYLPVMLGAYYLAFKDLFTKEMIAKYFPRVIYYAIMIVNFVMVVAHFTNTNFNSYSQMKAGENGWFYSANEVGSLLAIALPIVLWFVIQQTKTWRQWYYWISIVATVYSCLLLGTKAGILSIFGTFIVAALVALIYLIKAKGKDKKSITLLITFCLVLVGMKISMPMMAASQNIQIQEQRIKEQQKILKRVDKLENKKHLSNEERTFLLRHAGDQAAALDGGEIQDTTKSLIFSSRTVYLNRTQRDFSDAPLVQKLLGMGVGGNYQFAPKTIEMDFFDLFFEFGILGFIIVIIPLLLALSYLLKMAIKNWRELITYKYALLLLSVAIGVGSALVAGHVLMSPAVAIYLVVIITYLINEYQNKKTSN